jgi:hypothetical protein
VVLLEVLIRFECGESWIEKDDLSRNVRAEKDLFIVGSSIILLSVLAVLFL